jgi:alkylation response protein AidB-like acyl-CoA dehydrogenase
VEQWEVDLIASVRQLSRTKFAARATQHDREGSFPAQNIAELKMLGIPGMTLAKHIGGLGIGAEAQMRILEEIAYGDGSTAVALNMHVVLVNVLTFFAPFPRRNAVLRDIGRNGALICGPGSIPLGDLDNRKTGYKAVENGDTLVVNGKAGFASMSEGAKYTLLVATIARLGRDPDIALLIPELTTPGIGVLHNWDAMGLRGTASHDIIAENVVIPKADALVLPVDVLRDTFAAQSRVTNAVSQAQSRGPLGMLAIWLGLAQAAFDFTIAYVKQRYGYMAGVISGFGPTTGYRARQPWAQFGIGNMEHWLETGRIVLYDTVRRLDIPFEDQQTFVRHLVRTVYHLRRMSEEISQGAMRVCGAHAYVRTQPLERIFRDMVGGNVMAWKTDELLLSLGQGALGMQINFGGPAGT